MVGLELYKITERFLKLLINFIFFLQNIRSSKNNEYNECMNPSSSPTLLPHPLLSLFLASFPLGLFSPHALACIFILPRMFLPFSSVYTFRKNIYFSSGLSLLAHLKGISSVQFWTSCTPPSLGPATCLFLRLSPTLFCELRSSFSSMHMSHSMLFTFLHLFILSCVAPFSHKGLQSKSFFSIIWLLGSSSCALPLQGASFQLLKSPGQNQKLYPSKGSILNAAVHCNLT